MAQHQPYITLDSIITDYMTEAEVSNNKYFKLFNLAFRGMEQLGIDFFYKIQSVKLPINDNFTVNIPADYINWTKVGVLNDKGEIIPMYYNDKMTTYADLSADRVTKTQDDTLVNNDGSNSSVWYNYWTGGGFTNIYGYPSGRPFVGSFKVDIQNGVILLNEDFQYDYLMLEYVSSPVAGQDYYVPIQFREAVIAWLWWKDKRAANTNRGQVGISRDLRSDFYNERRGAIARWKPSRISELYEASQQMTRLAIKV